MLESFYVGLFVGLNSTLLTFIQTIYPSVLLEHAEVRMSQRARSQPEK